MNAICKTGLGCLLFGLMSDMVQAELYKYTNEDGVTVLDSHVPARYVKNGYTILSLDGRVLEVVPRALTDNEIRERDRRLAEEDRCHQTNHDIGHDRRRKAADDDGLQTRQFPGPR